MSKTVKKTTKSAIKKAPKTKAAVKKTGKTKIVAVKKVVKRKASVKKTAKKKVVIVKKVKKTKKKYDEVKSLKLWLFLVGFLLLLGLILSNLYWSQDMEQCETSCIIPMKILSKKVIDEPVLNIANPASMNCLEMNGNLELKERGVLGQYGVCVFSDGNECEEWALFRGECPVEGIEVGGHRTVLEYYCAITGGEIDKENKECIFIEGSACDLEDYYTGICHK